MRGAGAALGSGLLSAHPHRDTRTPGSVPCLVEAHPVLSVIRPFLAELYKLFFSLFPSMSLPSPSLFSFYFCSYFSP